MKRSIIIFPSLLLLLSFAVSKKKKTIYDKKFIESNLCLVPAGTLTQAGDQDLPYMIEKRGPVKIDNFYLFKHEITNGFYCHYLHAIRLTGDTALYRKVLPDTLVWRQKLAYNEPYVEYYLRHPAYADYPLVGVSYEQCLLFCEWLTAQYNNLPGRKFKKVKFDLPTEAQWEWAAHGGITLSIFPWADHYMQSAKGMWRANFMYIDQANIGRREFETMTVFGTMHKDVYLVASGGGDYMGVAGRLNDYADITAQVNSYWPNAYGLYNMSGNVEETVKEKGISKGGSWRDPGYYLRIASREQYDSTAFTSSERGFRVSMTVVEQ